MNPVNQRGFTSANGQNGVYTLDRWLIGDIWTSGACEARYYDGESLAFKEGLFQRFEVNKSVFANKTLTASALTAGGKLDVRTITLPANIVNGISYLFTNKGTAVFSNDAIRWNSDNIAEFRFETANAVSLVAAKLEFGDQQTLAHQDSSGNWELNEIPDYGEQLRRCQRYFYRFPQIGATYTEFGIGLATSATNLYVVIKFPVQMRAAPNLASYGSFRLLSADFNTGVPITAIEYNVGTNSASSDSVKVMATVSSGLTAGNPMYLQANNDPSAHIDFTADL